MGIFILSKDDNPESCVEAAIGNLKLWQEAGQLDHLLDFALGQILNATGLSQDQKQKVGKLIDELQRENTGV